MSIKEKIESDYIQALKAKNGVAVSTLRMLKAALHNKEIEKKGVALAEGEIAKIISKQISQREDSIEQFKKGGREELAQKESQELEILKAYLPKQLSEQEIEQIVNKVVEEVGAQGKSDFGKVMKQVMAQTQGRADGKLINKFVSSRLGG